jgi:branched-chain amino acid transport system substrate-binding protein
MKTYRITLLVMTIAILAAACNPAQTPAAIPTTLGPTAAVPTAVGPTVATDPASVAKAIHQAMNNQNLEAAMALVADNAVFKNAPPSGATLSDREAIRGWIKRQVDTKTIAEISDVKVNGDTATFTGKVTRGGATLAAHTSGAMTVTNGKITLWDFNPPSAPAAQAADPASVIQGFFDAVKVKNVEAALALFADGAAMYDPFGVYQGKDQLRARLVQLVATPITFEGSHFDVKGDHVTFDQTVFRAGSQVDAGPNEAIVQNGKIQSLGIALSAQATAAPTPATAELSDAWGVITVNKGDTIKLAVTNALSDDVALGARVAAADVGEVAPGFKIDFIYKDDPCSPDNTTFPGTRLANDLAANPQIAGVIGTFCSSTMLPASVVLDQAHYVMISASASAAQVTTRGLPTVNRTAFNNTFQAQAAARFVLNTLKLNSAAVVYDESVYGQDLAQSFRDAFQKGGGTVTNFVVVKAGEADQSAVWNQIAPKKPQLIYFAGNPDPAIQIAKGKTAAGLNGVPLMGGDGLLFGHFLERAGSDANGSYATFPHGQTGPGYADFVKKYAALGGNGAQLTYGPFSYDAMRVLIQAIKAVAKVDSHGNLEIPRQALALAVRATKDYPGLTGSITFDANGDRVASAPDIVIDRAQNGQWVQVFP